jgi:hypothetical protein
MSIINSIGWYLIGSGSYASGTITDLINSLATNGSSLTIHDVAYCIDNPWSNSQPFNNEAFETSDWVERNLNTNVEVNKGYWVLITGYSEQLLTVNTQNGYISGEKGKFYMKDINSDEDFQDSDLEEMFITDENGDATLSHTRKNDIKGKLCKVVTTGEGDGIDIVSEENINMPMENIFKGDDIEDGENVNVTPITTLKSKLYKKYKQKDSDYSTGKDDTQLLDESKELIYQTFFKEDNDDSDKKTEKKKYIDKDYGNVNDGTLDINKAKKTMNVSNKLSMIDTIIKDDAHTSNLQKDDVLDAITDKVFEKKDDNEKFNFENDIVTGDDSVDGRGIYEKLKDKLSHNNNKKSRIKNGLKETLDKFDEIINETNNNISEINRKIKEVRKKSKEYIKTKKQNGESIDDNTDLSDELKPEEDNNLENDYLYKPVEKNYEKPIEIAVEITDSSTVKFYTIEKVSTGINYIETLFSDISFNTDSSYIFARKDLNNLNENLLFSITVSNDVNNYVNVKLFTRDNNTNGIKNKEIIMLKFDPLYDATDNITINYSIYDTDNSDTVDSATVDTEITTVSDNEVDLKRISQLNTIIVNRAQDATMDNKFKFKFSGKRGYDKNKKYLLSNTLKPNTLEDTFDKANHNPYIIKCRNSLIPVIINSDSDHIKTYVSDEYIIEFTVKDPSMSLSPYFKIFNKFNNDILDDAYPELLMRGKTYKFDVSQLNGTTHGFDIYIGDESAKNTTPHGFTSYTKENNIITVTIPSNAPVDSVVNYYCTNTSHSDMKGSINISFRDISGKTYEWFYGSMKPTPEINLEVYVTGDFSNADLLGYNVKDGSIITSLAESNIFKYKA